MHARFEHDEFAVAQARAYAKRSGERLQAVGKLEQHGVDRLAIELLIKIAQPVDLDVENAGMLVPALRLPQSLIELAGEDGAVGEFGERIVIGDEGEGLLNLLLLAGAVPEAEPRDQPQEKAHGDGDFQDRKS